MGGRGRGGEGGGLGGDLVAAVPADCSPVVHAGPEAVPAAEEAGKEAAPTPAQSPGEDLVFVLLLILLHVVGQVPGGGRWGGGQKQCEGGTPKIQPYLGRGGTLRLHPQIPLQVGPLPNPPVPKLGGGEHHHPPPPPSPKLGVGGGTSHKPLPTLREGGTPTLSSRRSHKANTNLQDMSSFAPTPPTAEHRSPIRSLLINERLIRSPLINEGCVNEQHIQRSEEVDAGVFAGGQRGALEVRQHHGQ